MQKSVSRPFLGWRMVAVAFLAYNAGLGLTSGSFMPVLQSELGASRAAVSMAFGFMLLVIGLLAPVVGNVITKVSLRLVMPVGAAITASGFLWLAYADSLIEVLVAFGALVGSGACLMGVLAAPTLVGRWFDYNRGKALGLALMPLAILIAPPITAMLVEAGGSRLVFLSLAGLFVALIPILALLVVNKPEDVGQIPLRSEGEADKGDVASVEPMRGTGEIVTDIRFWLLSICAGTLTAAGVAFVSHGTGIAMERGFDLATAATAVSAYGAGTLIGPFWTLVVCMAMQVVLWLAVYALSTVPLMLLAAALIGTAGGATVAMHSAAMTELFGSTSFSRAMGYSYMLKIPFLFGAAPLAGYLFDISGGYASTLIVFVAALAIATACAVMLVFTHHRVARVSPAS
jgi:MFS family permease